MSRGWTMDDSRMDSMSPEDLDDITPTLNALAAEWSAIHEDEERRGFMRQSDCEDGYYDRETPECPECGREGVLALEYSRRSIHCYACGEMNPKLQDLVGIQCPYCNGRGEDVKELEREAKAVRQANADREVRIEIIEAMMARYGARMMRPYEHWNEDERYMEYMENRY